MAVETANATYENAALLAQAGIPISIMTGYVAYVPKSRILLFEAAVAAANGLGMEPALRTITVSAAKMLGISYKALLYKMRQFNLGTTRTRRAPGAAAEEPAGVGVLQQE